MTCLRKPIHSLGEIIPPSISLPPIWYKPTDQIILDPPVFIMSNILEIRFHDRYHHISPSQERYIVDTAQASQLFESLSSPIRLAIFQALSAMGTQGMIAGNLAKQLNLAPNHLSFHLKTLNHAGLITSQQEGRFVRYYANLNLMMDLTRFLTQNCCSHSHEQCC